MGKINSVILHFLKLAIAKAAIAKAVIVNAAIVNAEKRRGKMIGIIGAMEEEVAKLQELCEDREEIQKGPYFFVKGKLSGKEVVLCKAGIGKVNAAACTQALIDIFSPSQILNTGVAGAIAEEIHVLDLLVSKDAVQYDMDATEFGYPLGQIPREEDLTFAADEKMIEKALAVGKARQAFNTFLGRVATGDCFVSSQEKKEFLRKEFQASCCEMEGAAIAQIAKKNGVPFLILRFISDEANNKAPMTYTEFERKAIAHSVDFVLEFLK